MAADHPLALELSSLKTALDKYQHAAHSSSLQLQRAHLEASDTLAHSKLLEAENTCLKKEISFLRNNSEPTQTPRQVTELSLALRRVSDKLSHTEGILLQRTNDLSQAESEKLGLQYEVDASRAEAHRIRQAESESKSRERDLQRKCKAAEEEARMADAVVMEYADLVRSLECRIPPNHDTCGTTDDEHLRVDSPTSLQTRNNTLIHSLTENRYSLQRLLHEFNSETSDLQTETTRLHGELSTAQLRLDAECEISRQERSKLAEALVEVERCKADDETAGKIVSRYMRFSQSSIDMLQTALSTLKSRHAMTLATLSSSNESLSQALALERSRAARLRDILDQLTEDISRETFGRRREVALRLRSVVREERMCEALSIWLRRAEEHRGKLSATMQPTSPDTPSELSATLDHMIKDAHTLCASLSHEDPVSESPGCASLERIVLAEHQCSSLISELHEETEKRLALARTIGEGIRGSPSVSLQSHAIDPSKKPNELFQWPILSEVTYTSSQERGLVNHPIETQQTMEPSQLAVDVSNGEREKVPHVPDRAKEQDGVQGSSSVAEKTDSALSNAEETSSLAHPSLPSEEKRSSRPSSFFDELTHMSRRYEQIQHAFRDCHLALSQLKTTLDSDHSDKFVLKNVVQRLDDFCEDAQVELEIRVADEGRVARGFETILRVPGAIAVVNGEETRREFESFVDGPAPTIIKAQQIYTTKLADLQHDIAQVKRAFHELIASPSAAQIQRTQTPPVWSTWTPFLSTPPKRSSSPAPTFGTVITSPRSNRVASFPSMSNESMRAASDPYAHLDLRIPMPSQTHANSSSLKSPSELRSHGSSSRMYLLGLGGSKSGFVSIQESASETRLNQSNDGSDIGDNRSDIE